MPSLVNMNLTLPNPLIDLLWFPLLLYTWIQTALLTSTFQHSHASLLCFLSMFKAHSERISPSSCWWRQFTATCLWPLAFPQDLCKASDWSWQWLGGGQVSQGCFVPWSHSAHLEFWLARNPPRYSVCACTKLLISWIWAMFSAWQSNLFLNGMIEVLGRVARTTCELSHPWFIHHCNFTTSSTQPEEQLLFCGGYFSGTQMSRFRC